MEEDIKILEEKIEFWKNDPRIMIQEENYKILQVIENILKERQADKERIRELKISESILQSQYGVAVKQNITYKHNIKDLKEQVEMLDKAYSGAIKESKKYFEIVKDSIPKAKVMERIKQLNKGIEEFKKYVADSTGEEKQFYKELSEKLERNEDFINAVQKTFDKYISKK